MSSRINTSTPVVSPDHQRDLWEMLSCQFPGTIMKMLKNTPGIHSYELHLLYTILDYCQFRTPDHLFTKIHTLPSPVAAEIISSLKTLPDIQHCIKPSGRETETNADADTTVIIHSPGDAANSSAAACKPLFYSVEREELYALMQRLFAKGYLNDSGDGSMRAAAEIHDFETLHILYRLETEHLRAKKLGDTDLTEPDHAWYHEPSNKLIAQWTRHLAPLAPPVGEDDEDSDQVKIECE